jgi:cholesterol 24(S)-hydroxylase
MSKEDEEIMIDDFVTFFLGGQETTSNALAFTIMELGRNPECLAKMILFYFLKKNCKITI